MSAHAESVTLKRTPLYALHRELGVKLIDFGGWEMPVQYEGILEEHRAVRERAGIFGVSHMGELEVTGRNALAEWEADLGWIVKMKKGDFIGREALERQKEQGVPRKLVGFEMTDRGIARHGYAALTPAGPGVVTSGTHSPTLGHPIGLALLPSAAAAVGTEFSVDIRGRQARARVVETPFCKRKKEVTA